MYKIITMTDSQKYETLWAKFCNLADKAAFILSQYGSLYNCPSEKIMEYIQIGKEQELVQREISELPKVIQA